MKHRWLMPLLGLGCGTGSNPGANDGGLDGTVVDGSTDAGVPFEASVLMNAEAGTPSNYACGSFDAGSPQASVPHAFHVSSLRFLNAAGAQLVLVDGTGAPQGTPVTTDSSGNATLTVPSNTYVSWQITGEGCPDECVPTYDFGALTHTAADADAGAVENAVGYDIDDFVGYASQAGTLGSKEACDDAGCGLLGEVFGTVVDCDLAPVANAVVSVATDAGSIPLCVAAQAPTDAGVVLPCVVYADVHSPLFFDFTASATGPTGRFAVMGAEGAVTITVSGLIAGTTQPTTLGTMTVPIFPESVSLGTVFPQR